MEPSAYALAPSRTESEHQLSETAIYGLLDDSLWQARRTDHFDRQSGLPRQLVNLQVQARSLAGAAVLRHAEPLYVPVALGIAYMQMGGFSRKKFESGLFNTGVLLVILLVPFIVSAQSDLQR
jgi:hypothetical protein